VRPMFSRRTFLSHSMIGSAFLASGLSLATARESSAPVVHTTCGRIRGAAAGDVKIFKGIKYGASTAGANRFMPPQQPAHWSGVREALTYGPWAMQGDGSSIEAAMAKYRATDAGRMQEGLFRGPPFDLSEDCLVLNIWSPGLRGGKKRPVLF
jgi:para-nitrobenzyl esterase